MPTKKKIVESEVGSTPTRVTRQQQKKLVQPNQVTEIITSSSRKKKVVGTLSKAVVEDPDDGTHLDIKFKFAQFGNYTCVGYNADHGLNTSFANNEGCGSGTPDCIPDTIFSPSFHVAGNNGGELSSSVSADFYKFYQHGGQQFQDGGKESIQTDCPGGGVLSSENLECVDENNQDHMSTSVTQEDEDVEEFDDFDPYFFIKNLPDLSSVVPTFRPVLLPKQTRSCPSISLVLDLDETLVHSSLEPCDDVDFTFAVNFNSKEHTIYVRCRPHLKDFLERVSRIFEIIIFTASQSIYAEKLLNVLDPKRKLFRHRVYRDSCLFVEGNYLKDLSVLGRDLARVVIIDNSPQAFGFQVENGIPIESWFDDRSDRELMMLLPFLESLAGVHDVRPLIAQKYNLQDKIAAAVCPLDF